MDQTSFERMEQRIAEGKNPVFDDMAPLGQIPKEDFPFALLLMLGIVGLDMNKKKKENPENQ